MTLLTPQVGSIAHAFAGVATRFWPDVGADTGRCSSSRREFHQLMLGVLART